MLNLKIFIYLFILEEELPAICSGEDITLILPTKSRKWIYSGTLYCANAAKVVVFFFCLFVFKEKELCRIPYQGCKYVFLILFLEEYQNIREKDSQDL